MTRMVVGNTQKLAIESGITCAYEQPSLIALGVFLIHVAGVEYGVREPDASMLANSLDSVKERMRRRGEHTANFANESAAEIALAFMDAVYWEGQNEHQYFGSSRD